MKVYREIIYWLWKRTYPLPNTMELYLNKRFDTHTDRSALGVNPADMFLTAGRTLDNEKYRKFEEEMRKFDKK